ncbi:MAG: hypothetical protein AAF502_05345 [Bacteroidota bacterium]
MKKIFYILFPIAITLSPLTEILGNDKGILLPISVNDINSNKDTVILSNPADQFPPVFLIGEDPDSFEALSGIYKTNLLTACREDMDMAFRKWMEMMLALESFAENAEFDINGTKMWIKVFWGTDGTVEHVAYHLKPNSRNADLRSLTEFFEGFIRNYKFPISFDTNFSHYGSASFPTFYKRALSE